MARFSESKVAKRYVTEAGSWFSIDYRISQVEALTKLSDVVKEMGGVDSKDLLEQWDDLRADVRAIYESFSIPGNKLINRAKQFLAAKDSLFKKVQTYGSDSNNINFDKAATLHDLLIELPSLMVVDFFKNLE